MLSIIDVIFVILRLQCNGNKPSIKVLVRFDLLNLNEEKFFNKRNLKLNTTLHHLVLLRTYSVGVVTENMFLQAKVSSTSQEINNYM